ncbi:hypothetical protein [Flavobacterium sp. CLA17]|uniref:hypothetical protein n=1 Tax=Flavobacterium sp. CLA17 TaxID=2724135 RepID=UPI0014931B8D|nr:hypothetical protein [Flavobacterium sp. CLA17]QSB25414.1 hypothetical protein HAV12_013635 [Flavobacterium sp. CLA17]
MSKLSKKELAALDLLIAHLEENGSENLSFISSIVNAVSDAVTAVTNVVSNPSVTSIANAVTAVCPIAVAAIAVAKDEAPTYLANVDSKATLNELINLRNKNS